MQEHGISWCHLCSRCSAFCVPRTALDVMPPNFDEIFCCIHAHKTVRECNFSPSGKPFKGRR